MTSKHYRWQTRWRIEGRRAIHESGLVVEFDSDPGTRQIGIPANARKIESALRERHGHNARAMILRLVKEAERLYENR